MLQINSVNNGNCLELMSDIDDKSIDMILCDLPYGVSACKWDSVIPFEPLWAHYKRIIKDNGAIVLFGSEPFSSYLRISNIKQYKYDWIWNKRKPGNIFLAKYQPMKTHEIISVFNSKIFYPIKTPRDKIKQSKNYGTGEAMGGDKYKEDELYIYTDKNPISILDFSNASQNGKFHPTQKPVALFEYLIKTYTNEGELVLDNCAGSGTTAIACLKANRNYILIEQETKYCDIANKRIAEFTL
jgi:DNA modification methylase